MQKLLFFFLLLLGIFLLRRWMQREDSAGEGARDEVLPSSSGTAEKVLECRVCGLLVPESEVVLGDGEHFCSAAHAREFKSGGGRT